MENPFLTVRTHNGLRDSWERQFGVSDPHGDPDGDGFSNLQEYLAGTDPLDAQSKPGSSSLSLILVARLRGPEAPSGTLLELAWSAALTRVVLEGNEDLGDPHGWVLVPTQPVMVGSERVVYEHGAAGVVMRYYRVRQLPR